MATTNWRTPSVIPAAGYVILAISPGIRHGFGLFPQPMSMTNGLGVMAAILNPPLRGRLLERLRRVAV